MKNINLLLIIAILFTGAVMPSGVSAYYENYATPGGTGAYYNGGFNYNYNFGNNGNYPSGQTPSGGTVSVNPIVLSLSPNIVKKSSTPVVVAVIGNNFLPSSKVKLNGMDQSTTYVGPTRLDVYLTNLHWMDLGNVSISVYNPSPNGGFSNTVPLTIVMPDNINTSPNANNTSPLEETLGNISDTGLGANAIFASNGFLPSNLFQWIIFFIFILLIVYLWRKVYHADNEQKKPLKHA